MARGNAVHRCGLCRRAGHDQRQHRSNPEFYTAGGKVHPIRGSTGYSEAVRARIDRQKRKGPVATTKANRPKDEPVRLKMRHYASQSGWVAKLTGTDSKFGFARSFERADSETRSASGKTGNNEYALRNGTYEVDEPYVGRYFLDVAHGKARRISKDEARRIIQELHER